MDSQGKYLKLYEDTRKDIIDGVFAKGSKLPSKRVMAESKGVSVITVSHAYELLAEEGYIVSKEKSGYFVSYDERTGFAMPTGNAPYKKHINGQGYVRESSAFSFSIYAKTVRKVLSDYAEEIMAPSPWCGTDVLREAICGYLARSRRIKVKKEQIIVGSGAEYLYELIVEAMGRDITYGIESPSYLKIEKVYAGGGAKIDMLPLSEDGIKSEALWKTDARVLHISPYRSFPSGVMASAGKKREYIRWSEEKDAVIVEDDYESEFSPSRKPEESLFSLDKGGRVIYVNTFSQTVGSFVRTAYMVVPAELLDKIYGKCGFHSCPVPTPEQYVLAELINNGDFERHINRVRRNTRKRTLDKSLTQQ